MSTLKNLIDQTKARDPQLGEDLQREFDALASRLPFGLNFERHRPEVVELPGRVVRRGDKVRVLPPRGSAEKRDQRVWRVTKLDKAHGQATLLPLDGADAAPSRGDRRADSAEPQIVSPNDLVVVAEFRDTLYPGFISTGGVKRGGNKPCHTVINGENYHVLKALTWTHRGKVDAIYIDPPYNTGAKDWKYNNDYVEGDDLYRHSKWLAMMERRLLAAKELLNPADSVMIVTIDEKEYLRLEAGDVIPGSGGCRKLRWSAEGRGKRGGLRIVYFTRLANGQIVLVTLYAKNVTENIAPSTLRALKEVFDEKAHRKGAR